MPEVIKVLNNDSVSISLFNIMSMYAVQNEDKGDILSLFNLKAEGNETEAEISIYINGVEVPAIELLTQYFDNLEYLIELKAKDLINEKVADTIGRLYEIERDLDELEGKIKSIL